jgi:hypothetical protein
MSLASLRLVCRSHFGEPTVDQRKKVAGFDSADLKEVKAPLTSSAEPLGWEPEPAIGMHPSSGLWRTGAKILFKVVT